MSSQMRTPSLTVTTTTIPKGLDVATYFCNLLYPSPSRSTATSSLWAGEWKMLPSQKRTLAALEPQQLPPMHIFRSYSTLFVTSKPCWPG